ncbi:unnamed protein product [Cuscuta epithymum]|uniref:Uncharacterized protein n=1 Tax=Cuscuta epithymum TaxID=186058 RepID=A0AAV0G2G0_9ASTE|nr:unnamed protein product [Cuscuta epithymum]
MRISRFKRLFSLSRFFPDDPPASYIQRTLFRLPFPEEGGCISRRKRECSPKEKRDCSFPKEPISRTTLRRKPSLMEQVYESIPRYPETSKNLIKVEEGMVVDAGSILSMFPMEMRRRVRDSKYLIVYCFMAPILFDDCQSRSIGSFVSVSSELRTLYGSDIEMILVAKMRQKWSKDKASFDHFFSGFPSFSNVIPFSNTTAHDHICLQLGLNSYFPIYLLLERFSASTNYFYRGLRHRALKDFDYYGAGLFPFTQDILENWRIFRGSVYRKFPPDLDKLLGCKSSELQVCKFSTLTGGG